MTTIEKYHDEVCPNCNRPFKNQDGVKDFIKEVWQRGVSKADGHKANAGENWHDKAIIKGKVICANCHQATYIQARFSHEEADKVITTYLMFITPILPKEKQEIKSVVNAF